MKTTYTSLFALLFAISSLSAQTFTDSNLPILVITTDDGESIPDEPKVTAHLGLLWHENGDRNYLTDAFSDYDGQIGIEIRGQSSQWFDKKSYGFETRNDDGSNNNVPLLGMPKENDWVLHGPFSDKSLIRNALAYTLAGKIMAYAPRVRMVEMQVNGDYLGVYLLTEKIKRDDDRVDIAKLDFDDNAGDSITGGYILKMDKYSEGDVGFVSNYKPIEGQDQDTWFLIHYPKSDDLTGEQFDYIRDYMVQFENVLKSSSFAHPTAGYRQYMDAETFIDQLFINEISRNIDGYRLSNFFYKDKDSKDGRLKMGPVWDYNLSFGNADYCEGWNTEGWGFHFNNHCPGDGWVIHFWWERLLQDPNFRAEMNERWTTLRAGELSDESIFGCFNELAAQVAEGQERNFEQYPILGEYIWPNSFVGNTWNAEINFMNDWLIERLAWLDGAMLELTSIYDTAAYFAPNIYPNPTSSAFEFEYYVERNTDVHIQLFNAQGQFLGEQREFAPTQGRNTQKWNAPQMRGVYFYTISFDQSLVSTGKVVVF